MNSACIFFHQKSPSFYEKYYRNFLLKLELGDRIHAWQSYGVHGSLGMKDNTGQY